MELPSGVGEHASEVVQALQVAKTDGLILKDQRPVLALSTEDISLVRISRTFFAARLLRARGLERGAELLEDRPCSSELEQGPGLVSLRATRVRHEIGRASCRERV